MTKVMRDCSAWIPSAPSRVVIAAGLGLALAASPTIVWANEGIAVDSQVESDSRQAADNELVSTAEDVSTTVNDEASSADQSSNSGSDYEAEEGVEPGGNATDSSDEEETASGAGGLEAADALAPEISPETNDSTSANQTDGEGWGAGTPVAATPAPTDVAKDTSSDAPSAEGWNSTKDKYADKVEKDGSVSYVWRTGWLVDASRDQGLQRYWFDSNGNLVIGSLIDTLDGNWVYARSEGYVVRGLYKAEDGMVYYADNDGRLWNPGWHVANVGQGLQRYYVDSDSHGMKAGYSDAGYAHYTTSDGYVVRGKYDNGAGRVYLADNDGKLEAKSGWVVTGKYDSGALQRYYVEQGAAKSSYFTQDGSNYYGIGGEGYVLRGYGLGVGNQWLAADNDGKLAKATWVVTDAFGNGLQRYWFADDSLMAKNRLVAKAEGAGWWAWARADGTILRAVWDNGKGRVFLADNDGRLAEGRDADGSGWLVTGRYTGGTLQRYFIDGETHAARSSFFEVDGAQYYGLGGVGYVMRNGVDSTGKSLSNNEGAISGSGWIVTSSFGFGLQRYWLSSDKVATSQLIDAAAAGYDAYARPEGFVVRGKYTAADGLVYVADNDGKLPNAGWCVTGMYDGGLLQRYYIDEKTHACKSGVFQVGAENYLGLPTVGYVLRGTKVVDGKTFHADNDGALVLSFASDVKTGSKKGTGTVTATFVGDTPYLFLPAHASLSGVSLKFETFDGSTGVFISLDGGKTFASYASGDTADITAVSAHDGVRALLFKTSDMAKVRTLAVMMSANVRAMYLVSEDPVNKGRLYVDGSPDHSAKATGVMLLVDPDGTVVYNGDLTQIKGRGNTTWSASAKKPYQIKLDKKTDLLETGNKANKAKTWLLLANANDATLMHNTIAYQLAKSLGITTTPECAPIDLYYDGEYRGSYLLSEKVEINSGRVDIYKLEDAIEEANPDVDIDSLPVAQGVNKYGQTFQYVKGLKGPADSTGGYLLELDIAYYRAERCWFTTSKGAFVVKDPESLSYNQMKYVSELMQETVDACNDANLNSYTGKSIADYVSGSSFARMFAINEFTKNSDYCVSSSFFYLPSNSDKSLSHKFYCGPAWDFDAAFGIRNDGTSTPDPNSMMFDSGRPIWYTGSSEIGRLINSSIINELLPKVEKGVLASKSQVAGIQSIDEIASHIRDSQRMNQMIWGLTSFANSTNPLPTFEQNVQQLKNWISQRVAWAKSYFA